MTSRLVIGEYPPGSMLKPEFAPERHRREKRERDNAHLANIRLLSCVACGALPPTQAAHVRMLDGARGKRIVGMQIKPGDLWCVPLCQRCHDEQHRCGERLFWSDVGIHPVRLALRLYRSKHNVETMQEIIRLERESVR